MFKNIKWHTLEKKCNCEDLTFFCLAPTAVAAAYMTTLETGNQNYIFKIFKIKKKIESIDMVKQKVVTADFRRAVSKPGHDFGLALFLHVVLAIFCQNFNVSLP